MNVVSLCSGVGLIDLGLEWAGMRTVQFCEINTFGQKVIAERFPGVPIHPDAWTITPKECDVIAAGFPCQPFSLAGKGLGADDPRHLWPAIIRAICMARPRYVILENVPGLVNRGLSDVLGDLADAGFDAEWTVFGAADVGAPHLRRRVWIVATSDTDRSRVWDEQGGFFRQGWGSAAVAWAKSHARPDREGQLQHRDVPDADGERCAEGVQRTTGHRSWTGDAERRRAVANVADADEVGRHGRTGARDTTGRKEPIRVTTGRTRWWSAERGLDRVAHGQPNRMDRLSALGNGVVPQCAELVGLRLRMLDGSNR